MQRIDCTQKEIDLKAFVRRQAQPEDAREFIRGDALIYVNDQPRVLYRKLKTNLSELATALRGLRFGGSKRYSGLSHRSRTFGYMPRTVIRQDYCSASALRWDAPATAKMLTDFAAEIAAFYRESFPETYAEHDKWTTENVLPEWRMGQSPFTSGIINKTSALKYHFDAGNVKNCFSNMVVLRDQVEGGHLVIPELDVALECADSTIVLFNGQNLLHGVTPIKKLKVRSYRFSIVYYTLQQMWNCETVTEEMARIRKVHYRREANRKNRKREELAGAK